MKSIILVTAIIFSSIAHAQSFSTDYRVAHQQASFSEQKYLADRCRLIRERAYASGGSGFGSGQIHMAITNIEDFLLSFRSPLSMQMLGDLQNSGYKGFNAWCKKYGI